MSAVSENGFATLQNLPLKSNPEAVSAPSTLDEWKQSNVRATRQEADSGSRMLAYCLLTTAFALFSGIAWGLGWFDWMLS